MKRSMTVIAATLALSSAFAVSAKTSILHEAPAPEKSNWEVSANYHAISTEVETGAGDIDLNTGVASVGFGYTFQSDKGHVSLTPELHLGTGIVGDDIYGVDIDIDSMVSISSRISLHPTELFTVYARPSYTRISVEGDSGDWEFGAGIGGDIKLSENVKFGLDYSRIAGDSDVVTASLRYNF